MYSSSPTTGDWETYITHDLVSYVDTHYRTIAARESRGLGGHSMGGYGVWRIAMKHPELYSSIYSLSPCCLMNNPRPRPANAPAPPPPPQNGAAVIDVASGEAAAWSPNPQNPPLYFDRPVVDGKLQPEIAAKWIANSPLAMVNQSVPNLKKYDAIAMDVGLQDTLLGSIREMDQSLTRLGIAHTFETFEGGHSDHLRDRIEFKALPFFSQHLAFPHTSQ
jgi:S-formylglutathione hydrolase FrmB